MRFSYPYFSQMAKNTRTFLFWFSSEHSNFKFAEIDSLFQLHGLDKKPLKTCRTFGPFVLMDFPNEDIPKKLMNRSFLAHSCYELWASGESMQECHKRLKTNLHFTQPYLKNSFKVKVEAYGKTVSQSQKISLIESFDYIPFEGKVDLTNPQCSLHLIQYFGLDGNRAPEEPYQVFFGRWVSDGQRRLINLTSLKDRKFIGNTSMDPLLSLLMANLAVVKDNDFVLDPFVGTGSLLVAAALMGGFVIGTDIDYLMLHARTRPTRARQEIRTKDESVRANLQQYGVEDKYLDVLIADASRPTWRPNLRFDAIITDPPYGVRESTERIGSYKNNKIKEGLVTLHIPEKIDYCLTDIFTDLLSFGAERLVLGGRMVFWIPISRESYEEDKLPQNPCFNTVANCEQVLTLAAARRLIVLEKIREPTADCRSVMDGTALMYRFQFFTPNDRSKTHKEKKCIASLKYGKGSKKGQEV